MPKLGVITDGISRDFEHAVSVMDEFGIEYAELQFLWDKEVGDLDRSETKRVKDIVTAHGKTVSSISRHNFAGMPMTTKVDDPLHQKHMDGLKRCIDMAHEFDCDLVRIMSGRKEMILFGYNGAEQWNVAKGAWEALLPLVAPAVELAREAGVTLHVETGNGTMVHSCWTGRRLIDDLDAKDVLKVLWDPANSCYSHETAFPDGYEELKDGYIGHVHIKDVYVDTPRATLEVRPMGEGMLADQFQPLSDALKADGYSGSISYESVYHPGDGDFEKGFRQCYPVFAKIFG